jgi:hypothetical protein
MRTRFYTPLAFALALAALPLIAQTGSTEPATAWADQHHLTGVIVSLGTDKLDVKVESVSAEPESTASGLVGNVESFTLDANVKRPALLSVGDRVDVAYSVANGSRTAFRIDVAPASAATQTSGAGSSPTSGSDATQASSSSSTMPTSGTGGGSAPAPSSPDTSSSASGQQPTSTDMSSARTEPVASSPGSADTGDTQMTAATEKAGKLPQTASPLPLIGLVGLAALLLAGVLRLGGRA